MKKILNKNFFRKVRRIYAYFVGGGFTAFFAVYDIPESTQSKFYFWIGVGAVVIQAFCDNAKEPLPTLPHNKVN